MTSSSSSGENLLLLAAAASLRLAQGRTADELGQLAAFCTVLGDNLALLALSAPSGSVRENPRVDLGMEMSNGSSSGLCPAKFTLWTGVWNQTTAKITVNLSSEHLGFIWAISVMEILRRIFPKRW